MFLFPGLLRLDREDLWQWQKREKDVVPYHVLASSVHAGVEAVVARTKMKMTTRTKTPGETTPTILHRIPIVQTTTIAPPRTPRNRLFRLISCPLPEVPALRT